MSFGGKAAHDALQRLAISVDPPRAFVDRDVRAANLRRLRDDAVGECLRIFQLCAAPALGDGGNLRLVLTPCVRWCVCARLLRAVGRRVDEAVRRDVAAAVEAVAAAARERVERDEEDQRSDGFAQSDGGPSTATTQPARYRSPVERTMTVKPRRSDRSTTGSSQTRLIEDAERVVAALADQMLGGWKGAPAESGDSPGGDPTDDAEREWRDVANDAARDFADAVEHPLASALLRDSDDVGLAVTECVDRMLTPAAVAVANAAARVAAGADDVTREGHSHWTAFEPPAACATAAADCCDRVRTAAEKAFSRLRLENEKENEGREHDRGTSAGGGFGFGFGIAAFTGSAGAGGGDSPGGDSPGTRDFPRSRDTRATSLARLALRRTCEAGTVAEELAVVARTAHAAVSAVSAVSRHGSRMRTRRSGVKTPHGATTTANSEEEEEEEEGIRAARADARRALRSCDSAARCARALADKKITAALYLPLITVATRGTTNSLAAAGRRRGGGFVVIHGSQAARDFAREGDGIALAAGFDTEFVRHPTGPFLAHFVAACGAVEAALRSQRTLDVNDDDDDDEGRDDPVEGTRAPGGRETRISRWMSVPTIRQSRREGDGSAERDAYARAAARVVLCACRTVRGGDALDFVHDLFPPAAGFVAGTAQPSETAGFYDEEMIREEDSFASEPNSTDGGREPVREGGAGGRDATGTTRGKTSSYQNSTAGSVGTNERRLKARVQTAAVSNGGFKRREFSPVEVRVTRRRVVVTSRDGFVVSRDEGVLEGSRRLDGGVPTDLRAWCVVCVVSEQTLEPTLRGSVHPSRLAQLEPGTTSIRLDPRASRERMDARLRALRSGNRT